MMEWVSEYFLTVFQFYFSKRCLTDKMQNKTFLFSIYKCIFAPVLTLKNGFRIACV